MIDDDYDAEVSREGGSEAAQQRDQSFIVYSIQPFGGYLGMLDQKFEELHALIQKLFVLLYFQGGFYVVVD